MYGYINQNKSKVLRTTIIMYSIVLLIYFVGYFANDRSNANVFTILAILVVLPSSKHMVHYMLLYPYKSIEKNRYDKICSELGISNVNTSMETEEKSKKSKLDGFGTDIKEQITLCVDLVLTSQKKVMNLDALIVGKSRIVGLAGKENQDIAYIERYLCEGIQSGRFGFDIKIYSKEQEYLNAVKSLVSSSGKEEEMKEMSRNRKDLLLYIKSLVA